jgi:hypothetical protein
MILCSHYVIPRGGNIHRSLLARWRRVKHGKGGRTAHASTNIIMFQKHYLIPRRTVHLLSTEEGNGMSQNSNKQRSKRQQRDNWIKHHIAIDTVVLTGQMFLEQIHNSITLTISPSFRRNALIYTHTISRTLPTCHISLGSLTLPASEAGDFEELILL